MSLPKPTIVIFDMDGTTVRHLNPRLLGVMEWLDDTAYRISRLWAWVFERKAQGPMLLPGEAPPTKRAKSIIVHRALHKFRRKPVEQLVEPCPGIIDVLALLKSHGVPTALISNGLGKGYGADIVEKFDLDQYFGAMVFREDIHKSKPAPEALIKAIEWLGITPGANDVVWFVGDRHKDVTAAQAAEKVLPCKFVPVAYGMNAAMAVMEKGYGPTHIIVTYADLDIMLRRLLGAPGSVSAMATPISANASARK